jgi:catechol 2,3-dioxygenase-like lactoylglutathione lyase family enzyme
MSMATETQLTTFHISLNVSDLGRSIEFYQTLFNTPAAKRRADYAKFELADPPLVLSLEPCGASSGGALNHVGFRLADAAALVELQRRLEVAGIGSIREEGVECCYARQTKFWVQDPDRTLWEFYVLESNLECAGDARVPETVPLSGRFASPTSVPRTASDPTAATDAFPPPGDWEHRLGSLFPRPLPFADGTLQEVRLRGTFNVPCEREMRRARLAECLRVLAPGGRIVLHHLTGASRLPSDSLPLPGPAVVVDEVPVDAELLGWVTEAGFGDVRLLKFGSAPSFTVQGVELRETIVEALKPPSEADTEVVVVYKGPFCQLVDDANRVFRRGERTRISRARWESIAGGPLEESFVRLRSDRPGSPV